MSSFRTTSATGTSFPMFAGRAPLGARVRRGAGAGAGPAPAPGRKPWKAWDPTPRVALQVGARVSAALTGDFAAGLAKGRGASHGTGVPVVPRSALLSG
jgi:hypothetical protein